MSLAQTFRYTLLAVASAVVLAGCQGTEPPQGTSAPTPTVEQPEQTAPPATEAPAPEPTTAPPAAEEPAEAEGEGLPPEAIWIGLGLLFVVLLIGWAMGRSRKDTPAPVAATSEAPWKDYTREGYSEARWLHDSLTEELAVWRGNALFEKESGAGAAAGSSLADTWAKIGKRTDRATDSLYRAEAAVPDQTSTETIRNVVAALQATRSAVDSRAEAHFNARGVDASDQGAVADGVERERLASATLTEARDRLNGALSALGAIS